jgi:hypothetical protein
MNSHLRTVAKTLLVCLLASLKGCTFSHASAAPLPAPDAAARLIRGAGTTGDESERLRLLRELEANSELDPALRADLDRLLPVVEDWANGKFRVAADPGRAASPRWSPIPARSLSRPSCFTSAPDRARGGTARSGIRAAAGASAVCAEPPRTVMGPSHEPASLRATVGRPREVSLTRHP